MNLLKFALVAPLLFEVSHAGEFQVPVYDFDIIIKKAGYPVVSRQVFGTSNLYPVAIDMRRSDSWVALNTCTGASPCENMKILGINPTSTNDTILVPLDYCKKRRICTLGPAWVEGLPYSQGDFTVVGATYVSDGYPQGSVGAIGNGVPLRTAFQESLPPFSFQNFLLCTGPVGIFWFGVYNQSSPDIYPTVPTYSDYASDPVSPVKLSRPFGYSYTTDETFASELLKAFPVECLNGEWSIKPTVDITILEIIPGSEVNITTARPCRIIFDVNYDYSIVSPDFAAKYAAAIANVLNSTSLTGEVKKVENACLTTYQFPCELLEDTYSTLWPGLIIWATNAENSPDYILLRRPQVLMEYASPEGFVLCSSGFASRILGPNGKPKCPVPCGEEDAFVFGYPTVANTPNHLNDDDTADPFFPAFYYNLFGPKPQYYIVTYSGESLEDLKKVAKDQPRTQSAGSDAINAEGEDKHKSLLELSIFRSVASTIFETRYGVPVTQIDPPPNEEKAVMATIANDPIVVTSDTVFGLADNSINSVNVASVAGRASRSTAVRENSGPKKADL